MNTMPPPSKKLFISQSGLLRIIIFAALTAAVLIPLYAVSSASAVRKSSRAASRAGANVLDSAAGRSTTPASRGLLARALMPQAAPGVETVTIYQADCATPETNFTLGQTVCAKITGSPSGGGVSRRLVFVYGASIVAASEDVTADGHEMTFTLPSTATSLAGDTTVDNRGRWSVVSVATSDGYARSAAWFTVKDPSVAVADLSISDSRQVAIGDTLDFYVYVINKGPDAATNVVVTDVVPAGVTFDSATQESGPAFTCVTPMVGDATGTTTCTIASLGDGAVAEFKFRYKTTATAVVEIEHEPSIASTTVDNHPADNASEALASSNTAGGGNAVCSLDCPANITVTANATQGGNPGAFVNFSSAEGLGECGEITSTQASGSFFPVGDTTVGVSSTTGGGSCSFTVTVVPAGGGPTISCPADVLTAAAAGADEATVDPGTPTTNPASGVSVSGLRSDNQPLSAPYPIGTTVITWRVTDASGLTSSCTQRVTVTSDTCGTDDEDPTITAPPNVTLSTPAGIVGSCGMVVGESELGTPEVSDNCVVHVTRAGVPAGNFFPVGTPTVITYTATDAAGNSASATQTVTVVDATDPIIAAPANATYTCPSEVPAASPSQATRGEVLDENGNPLPPGPPVDNCGTPNVTVADTTNGGAGSATNPLVITRTYTATDAAGNSASASQTITVADGTPPSITLNGAGSVTHECHTPFDDPGVTTSDNCTPGVTVATSGGFNPDVPGTYVITYTATDAAGNTAAVQRTVTVVDTTPPVMSCPADVVVYLPLNSTAVSMPVSFTTPTATDSCDASVPVTASHSSGDIFPVGTTTVSASATDDSGNTSACSFTVTVLYNFTGFFSPVANPPVINLDNAGRTEPLKFSLSGNKGLGIMAAGFPASQQMTCDASAPVSNLEGTETSGGSTLTYSASSDQYQYNWKTEKSWAGTCRVLVVKLNDGSEHRAYFKFK